MKNSLKTLLVLTLASLVASTCNAQGDADEKTRIRIKKTEHKNGSNERKVRFKSDVANQSKTPTKLSKRASLKSNASSVIPRLRRSPDGQIEKNLLSEQKSKKLKSKAPKSSATKLANRKFQLGKGQNQKLKLKSSQKPKSSLSNKRHAGKFKSPKNLLQTASKSRPKTKTVGNKRFAGKFQSPKNLLQSASSQRPKTTTVANKRFAGKFKSPKSLSQTASSSRPNSKKIAKTPPKSKYKFSGGKTSKALGGLAVVGVTGSALGEMSKTKQQLKSGKITKKQYVQKQSDTGVDLATGLYKLKKLNPTSAVLGDVIGTDPISLGGDIFKDIKNGNMDNTKRTLKNVKHSWNKSLTKQAFTDPKGAGKRVKKDLKKTGKKIKKGVKKAGDKVKGWFDKDKKKKKKKKKK